MKTTALVSALFFSGALAAIGSYCKDSKARPPTRSLVHGPVPTNTIQQGNIGTCQKTSKCNSLDGIIRSNLCPDDPSDVKCCFYPECNGSNICKKDTLPCSGSYSTGDCPGPKGYRCCNERLPPICGRGVKDRRCIVI